MRFCSFLTCLDGRPGVRLLSYSDIRTDPTKNFVIILLFLIPIGIEATRGTDSRLLALGYRSVAIGNLKFYKTIEILINITY